MTRFLLAVLLLLPTLYWVLAIHYAGPKPALLATALGIGYGVGALATLALVKPLWRALAIYAAGFALLVAWWSYFPPTNTKDWMVDVERPPRATVEGDLLHVRDLRNFEYRSETDFTPRYEDRTYDLTKIRGLDLFMSYWGSPAIAHTIMSWEFEDGPPLAISIETRKDKTQSYSTVAGFFKQYELFYVVADERDVIRVRTAFRGEEVYLYRLRTPVAEARALLLDYAKTFDSLADHPQFYDALEHNCTTSIRHHIKRVDPSRRFDWRLLVNGYADQMLWERGAINATIPFEEMRSRSRINEAADRAGNSPDFSAKIREGLPERPS